MAQSRLEKIGTIFTRITGLLRSGAMKADDKPIWYDLYEAFPPQVEPRFDRPVPTTKIRNIFYEEDKVRSKFHKAIKQQGTINMFDRQRQTQSQQFIKIYEGLKSQGALDEERIFETSVDLLKERIQTKTDTSDADALEQEDQNLSLSESFKEAKENKMYADNSKEAAKHINDGTKKSIGGINIQNLFKD